VTSASNKRQQLPPQIKKIEVLDRKAGKTVVRYQVTVDAGIDPKTSKRRQVRRRYATEKEARERLAEIVTQAATECFVPRKALTVEQLCKDWLTSLHDARATTLNGKVQDLAPLRERHGDLPVQKLTRPMLDGLLMDLRAGGTLTAKGNTRRPWGPRSLNKAVDAWRAVLAYGVERREIPHNFALAMNKMRRSRARAHKEMQTYTPAEIGQVLRVADKDRNGHLWYLALSGLRRGEIAGLRWADIDLDVGTLSIENNRVAAGSGVVVENEPKTMASIRELPLDSGLITVLRRASSRQAQERLALGGAYRDSGYVAVNAVGEAYTPDTLTRMWIKLGADAGVRRIRLHDARHSCGTLMGLRNVPTAVIAAWLGHSDPAVTAALYLHSQDDALKAAGKTLGALVTSS
jgi:integrase